jgi:Protein of unknown function (DUF2934)
MHGSGQMTRQDRTQHGSTDRRQERLAIAERAHELWRGAGSPEGQHLEFLLQAEAQLEASRHGHRLGADAGHGRHTRGTAHAHTGHSKIRNGPAAFH